MQISWPTNWEGKTLKPPSCDEVLNPVSWPMVGANCYRGKDSDPVEK